MWVTESSDQADLQLPLLAEIGTHSTPNREIRQNAQRVRSFSSTPQTLSPSATTATEWTVSRRNVQKPFEFAKETTGTTSIPGRWIVSVLHGANGTCLSGSSEPFQA